MKSTLLPLLTLIYSWTLGQTQLTASNPAPRVGDKIEINVTVEEESEKIITGGLKIHKILTDVGPVSVGPFKFTIGDKTYETDVLTIDVAPKLPDEIRDGIWIRVIALKGDSYLIIEQRMSSQWKKDQKSKNETSMTFGNGAKHATFNRELLEENGLDVISSSSSSSSQVVDKKDVFGGGTVSYQIQVFKFKKTDKFKKKIRIDKEAFTDFPANVKIDEIWIE